MANVKIFYKKKGNKTMNKTELINAIAEKSNVTKTVAADMVNAFIETVVDTVAKGESIQLVGFGTFTSAERKEREGVNALTKQKYTTPACVVPKFKPGKNFKDACNK